MDCMAQKVCYSAKGEHTYAYVALVEIKTKDGKPFCWVLYKYYSAPSPSLEISYKMQTFLIYKDAFKFFPQGRSVSARKKEEHLWEKTTDWLHNVAVGGTDEKHPQGTDVPVTAPDSFKQWLL